MGVIGLGQEVWIGTVAISTAVLMVPLMMYHNALDAAASLPISLSSQQLL